MMRLKIWLQAGLLLSAIGMAAPTLTIPTAIAQQLARFSQIDIEGNVRVDDQSIRSYLGFETGQPVSPAQMNDALQVLAATELFEDVKLLPQGNRLLVQVVEAPMINRINIEGNRILDDEDIIKVVALASRRAYTKAAAEADATRIAQLYAQAGRFAARINPVIIERSDNRVDLVFEVFEGGITEVERISFIGNRSYSDWRLRRVLATAEANLLSFIFSDDTYDENRVEFDKEKLREFYVNRGYVDFEVLTSTADLSADRRGVVLNFNIQEGQQYRFGEVSVTATHPSIDLIPMRDEVDVGKGEIYSARRVETFIERLEFEAGRQGVAFLDVEPRVTKNEAARTVDIEFALVQGPRQFVERIDIQGNSETLDRVIRRQFRIAEGDPFNAYEIRKAEQRIINTRHFSDVSVRTRPGSSPDTVVVDVDVEEAPTGTLSFGGSYAPDAGIGGTISYEESNFLGRGQQLAASIFYSDSSRIGRFKFFEPALFDQDLLAGFELFYDESDRDESSYQLTSIGLEPRVGFPLSEDSRLSLSYRLSWDEIRDVSTDASDLIKGEEGERLTSSLNIRYSFDRRNSPIDPTSGFIFQLDQELAGLGGDSQFSKTTGLARAYTSLFQEDLVLSAEIESGFLKNFGEGSRIIDRFFLGGDSFRGFQYGGVGPRDVGSTNEDALGGNMFAMLRAEARFPIGLPEQYGISGGVFADVGTLWSLDKVNNDTDDKANIRAAAGVSLFWTTPLGPLRFNFARPLIKESYDKVETFRFTIDSRF